MKIKSPFIAGLILAVIVVATDALNVFVLRPDEPFSWQAIAVAAGIAIAGYVGKFLTGSANTNWALFGSALIAIVPILSTGKIDWNLVVATFALKLLGLLSEGLAGQKDTAQNLQVTK